MRTVELVGVVAVCAGSLIAVQQGLAGFLDLTYAAVTLVGVIALLQGVRYANDRRHTEATALETGEPERRPEATVPGDDIDAFLDRVGARTYGQARQRRRLTERVSEIAIEEVAAAQNVPRETAAAIVDRGDWTDDRVAAAFLSSGVEYPLRTRIRSRLSGPPLYRRGLTATVAAVSQVENRRRSTGSEDVIGRE